MTYDAQFYADEDEAAHRSATIVLPIIFDQHPNIHTVIDVGCGTGAWAYIAQTLGRNAVGVDQDVPPDLRRPIVYINCDLRHGYPCTGFDLAICLEVAEHLPAEAAVPLVNGLARAGIILFSAATPGQQGVGHINCQPHEYWHDLFLTRGFQWEHVGPTLPDEVEDFYRRNMFIYTRSNA
jgi:SAM-dependent methyltransferase